MRERWKEDLGTGVADVDVEHQLQVRLMEALQAAIAAGAPRGTVGEILQQLEDTSNVHFMSEELLMRLHSWENYQQHTEEHRLLLEELHSMRGLFEHGAGVDLAAGAGRLENWLASHVRGMDRAFAQYVARGGLGSRSP